MFSDLIGNSFAKAYLKKLLNNPPSVMLFYGPKGVGKSLFAKQFALALIGSKKENNVDLYHIYSEGRDSFTVEQIRQIIENANTPPFESRAKVFIINDIEKLSTITGNALLKTLEEVKEKIFFILTTNDKSLVLSTIISRARDIQFLPIAFDEIKAYLEKQCALSEKEATKIANLAQGSLGLAKEIVKDQDLGLESLVIDLLSQHKIYSYTQFSQNLSLLEKKLVEGLQEGDFEQQKRRFDMVLSYIAFWFRDTNCNDLKYLFYKDQTLLLKKNKVNKSLNKILKIIENSREDLQRNIKPRNILENLFSNI